VPVTEEVGVTVAVTVGVTVGVGDGVVLVTVGVGVLVGFLVCVADGVGLGVVVCAGMTMTRGGGGGRTIRYTTRVTTKNAASAQVVGRIRRRAVTTGRSARRC
jgi:hypothetical protein